MKAIFLQNLSVYVIYSNALQSFKIVLSYHHFVIDVCYQNIFFHYIFKILTKMLLALLGNYIHDAI
jgi:hypothetical protein